MEGFESRYLLLMTEDYSALRAVQYLVSAPIADAQHLIPHGSSSSEPPVDSLPSTSSIELGDELVSDRRPLTIFGSKFPADLEYKQICYNINTVKTAMEMGRIIILLNLDELYESLYDALNQYYSFLGGERYVDIGLGTHRVMCKVHRNFELIVIARKEVVYERFPIPLINRLEKHFFSAENLLSPEMRLTKQRVEDWCSKFITTIRQFDRRGPIGVLQGAAANNVPVTTQLLASVFVGYSKDTIPMLLLEAKRNKREDAFMWCCDRLLQCAPLDSVIKANVGQIPVLTKYLDEQFHGGLAQLLRAHMQRAPRENLFFQISTFAHSLSKANIRDLSKELFERPNGVQLVSLQNFDSDQTFRQFLRDFLLKSTEADSGELLLVQCEKAQFNLELLACAQYAIEDEWENAERAGGATLHNSRIYIVLLVYLNRTWLMQLQNGLEIADQSKLFIGFPCGLWESVHLDELFDNEVAAAIPHLLALKHRPFSDLFQSRLTQSIDTVSTSTESTVLFINC